MGVTTESLIFKRTEPKESPSLDPAPFDSTRKAVHEAGSTFSVTVTDILKKDKLGAESGTYGRDEKCVQNFDR
jgi:hypothetical protein